MASQKPLSPTQGTEGGTLTRDLRGYLGAISGLLRLGFRAWGFGFGGLVSRVQGFGVWGLVLGFRGVWGSGFMMGSRV